MEFFRINPRLYLFFLVSAYNQVVRFRKTSKRLMGLNSPALDVIVQSLRWSCKCFLPLSSISWAQNYRFQSGVAVVGGLCSRVLFDFSCCMLRLGTRANDSIVRGQTWIVNQEVDGSEFNSTIKLSNPKTGSSFKWSHESWLIPSDPNHRSRNFE